MKVRKPGSQPVTPEPPASDLDDLKVKISQGRVLPILSHSVGNVIAQHREHRFGEDANQALQELLDRDFPGLEYLGRDRFSRLQYRAVTLQGNGGDARELTHQYQAYSRDCLQHIADFLDENGWDDLSNRNDFAALPISELARELALSPPQTEAEQHNDPIWLLADIEFPLYITTCHYGYLLRTLLLRGLDPYVVIYDWRQFNGRDPRTVTFQYAPDERRLRAVEYPNILEPSRRQPIILYLFGIEDTPNSPLLLTEDHCLDFFTSSRHFLNDLLHSHFREALAEYSLMILGYDLLSWEFRTILRSIIVPTHNELRDRTISIQIHPDCDSLQDVIRYFDHYLSTGSNINLDWRSAREFARELWQTCNPGTPLLSPNTP